MEIIIKNVRCFAGVNRLPLTPITILVGENSTGKSTFLAAVNAVCRTDRFPGRTGFNDAPFDLGGFENVVTRNLNSTSKPDSYDIGFHVVHDGLAIDTLATYCDCEGQSALNRIYTKSDNGSLSLNISPRDHCCTMTIRLPANADAEQETVKWRFKAPSESELAARGILYGLLPAMAQSRSSQGRMKWMADHVAQVTPILRGLEATTQQIMAIAPIRGRAQRTYDLFSDEFMPEGQHIPLMLANILRSDRLNRDNDVRQRLHSALEAFGRDSGLFDSVDILQLGDQSLPPFQVIVNVSGQSVNLADVGYGVSQCLPIVVQSILAHRGSILLLQQPEVHLHPRAQAALGSLFASLACPHSWFVIETHSDYLIDRIRQEVANKRIPHFGVSILYFERDGLRTEVHPLAVDEAGDIVDAPPSYRTFFLEEAVNLLSGGGLD